MPDGDILEKPNMGEVGEGNEETECFMGMPPGNAIPSGDIIGYHLTVTLGQDIMGTVPLCHQTPAPSIILDG